MIKYSGAGNTFVIMMSNESSQKNKIQAVRALSNPTTGVAVDGVLFLTKDESQRSHFVWDFYNSDGSVAEMCGNAARCAAKYVFEETKFQSAEVSFSTLAGRIVCRQANGEFSVSMPEFKIFEDNKTLSLKNNEKQNGLWIDTGVPHFVIEASLITGPKKYLEQCQELRNHTDFGPRGANITLLQVEKSEQIHAVTFERGVENFTLACGTGAVAAGVYLKLRTGKTNSIINMPGGSLNVEISDQNLVTMTGPAEKIAEINWYYRMS